MNIIHYSALSLGAFLGAVISPIIEPNTLFAIASLLVFVLIVLGLVALVENRGVKFVGLFRWGGVYRLAPQNWVVPMQNSWRTFLMFSITGVIVGGLVRVLFIVKA